MIDLPGSVVRTLNGMNPANMTEWFKNGEKPEHQGVYERDYGNGDGYFCYWDGAQWYMGTKCYYDAVNRKTISGFNSLPWRGLNYDPNSKEHRGKTWLA